MPIYQLTADLLFPDPKRANPEGLLAVGGDLRAERLILAYSLGIFPWYGPGYPILWWSPPQRCLMEPSDFHVSRSLRRLLRQARFSVTFDQAFVGVIRACAETRLIRREETWITPDMIDAYGLLHELGLAHSAEAWQAGELVGGIYGVSLGRAFFGESMFSRVPNASKVAFATLVQKLLEWEFMMIDCQITNPHLQSLGAYEITRTDFLRRLAQALEFPARRGKWG
jgi:leucyl/phenylalanyl-tRNA---protein transferase